MAILNNSNAISSGGYDINNSLRFRASASAYLNRTFGSTYTDKTKSTVSFWVKRGSLNVTNGHSIMWYNASGASGHITFAGAGAGGSLVNDCLYIGNRNATTGSGDYGLQTTQLFRDPSAWYHIMVVYDTGQATSSNRVKLYVNGTQVTAFVSTQYPSQNYQTTAFLGGNSAAHIIGYGATTGATEYFDGYLAEMHFVDGQALTPSSFGETDAVIGSWVAKKYTGTYGTNGFYLKYSDIATTSGSNAGLGKDFSGNTNYWTTNNISVTAGTTYDAMIDSPTLTSATVANYPTLNPLIKQISGSVTEGNLKGAGSSYECWGTMAFPSTGKYYFEYTHNGSTGAGNGPAIGIVGLNKPDEDYGVKYNKNGTKWLNGTNSISYGASYTTGDVIGVAYDADSNSITFYKNNTSQGATTTASGYTYLPYHFDNSGSGGFLNFGQRPFTYTPPTGFVRLNTYNLPDSTIKKGNNYMDAILYTGNGTNGRAITTGMATDFVWVKKRSGADNHDLQDRVRGAAKRLSSNATAAETAISAVASFTSTGFTVDGWGTTNENGFTYVAWSWLANGAGSTNTTGSITSTVSANTTAGFSIVTYTGTGSNATVGHGLGVAPKFIIAKGRTNVDNWPVGTSALGWNQHMTLNATNATSVTSSTWNNTAPTSTVFTIGTDTRINQNTITYVAYCWSEIAGFSKFGSYTGNGSTDGPFVYTGFRPKFVILKNSSAVGGWVILDTSRNTYNVAGNELYPNSSAAEGTGYTDADFLSNGFKLRVASDPNASSGAYIYMAFAENPFKNANAR